jgi:hypothetical protein
MDTDDKKVLRVALDRWPSECKTDRSSFHSKLLKDRRVKIVGWSEPTDAVLVWRTQKVRTRKRTTVILCEGLAYDDVVLELFHGTLVELQTA